MKRLGEVFARWRGRLDQDALEKAERERRESPPERRLDEEDFEARKDDTHVEEYFPGVHDEDL